MATSNWDNGKSSISDSQALPSTDVAAFILLTALHKHRAAALEAGSTSPQAKHFADDEIFGDGLAGVEGILRGWE